MTTAVTVEVIPPHPGNNYNWDHKTTPGHHKTKRGLLFKNSIKGETFDITFNIAGDSGIKFDPVDPFSVSWIPWLCKKKDKVTDFTVGTKTDYSITVHNENLLVWGYKYRLDFVAVAGGNAVTWDPIVDNQDGNHLYLAWFIRIVAALATVTLTVEIVASLLG